MKTVLNARNARWVAWFFTGLILLLMGIGLALQVITESPLLGGPFFVHFSEVVALSGFALVGALIASRHPRNPIGWIWLLMSVSFGLDHFVWGYAAYGYIAHPGSLLFVEVMIIWLYWLGRGTLGMIGITLLLLLFPTGEFLSSRWRLIAWIALGRVVVSIPFSVVAPDPIGYFPFPTDLIASDDLLQVDLSLFNLILTLVGILCVLAAAISLLLRLRHSRGVERQQIKWFVYAAAFMPAAFMLIALGGSLGAPDSDFPFFSIIGAALGVTTSLGLSVASAVAIFRYRLWDIDIIIRRTLVYGLLSSSLALVYFSSVVLFQRTLQPVIGQGSTLAIVVSTLIIAALFSPLRRRIQEFIDRRFYRRKYNAEKILATLSAGLREEVDIQQMSERLVSVVEETLQSESLSLWLQEGRGNKQSSEPLASLTASDQIH
ncbi:MAG: hypothetical protein PVG14_06895 [Anaerolineales bacterium]